MKRSRRLPDQPFICQERGEVSLHFAISTVQSRMRVAAPSKLVLDYTRSMMAFLLFVPDPAHIVMVGLGGGSLAKYCYATLAHSRFTALEISPEIIAMRDAFAIPPDDDRLRVLCADGTSWIHDNPKCCDVLMLDAFDADGLPAALYTQSFFDDCASALVSGGVLVSNIWAKENVRHTVLERLNHAFEGRVLTLLAEDGENTIAIATNDRALPSPELLHERARNLSAIHAVDLCSSATKLTRVLTKAP